MAILTTETCSRCGVAFECGHSLSDHGPFYCSTCGPIIDEARYQAFKYEIIGPGSPSSEYAIERLIRFLYANKTAFDARYDNHVLG